MSSKSIITIIVVLFGILLVLSLLPGKSEAPVEEGSEVPETEQAFEEGQLETNNKNVMHTNPENPVAVVTTNQGTFEIELFTDKVPTTAGNFKKLAEEGFYDGTKFHRIIPNFMIQGGDPQSKDDSLEELWGTGDPGYKFDDEFGEGLSNVVGTISMANSGPNTNGSQFFINVKDNSFLDFDKEPLSSKHSVFGNVISGLDIVMALSTVETFPNDRPVEPVVVESVVIK